MLDHLTHSIINPYYNVLLVELSLACRDVGASDLHGDLGYTLVSLLMQILLDHDVLCR